MRARPRKKLRGRPRPGLRMSSDVVSQHVPAIYRCWMVRLLVERMCLVMFGEEYRDKLEAFTNQTATEPNDRSQVHLQRSQRSKHGWHTRDNSNGGLGLACWWGKECLGVFSTPFARTNLCSAPDTWRGEAFEARRPGGGTGRPVLNVAWDEGSCIDRMTAENSNQAPGPPASFGGLSFLRQN
eukprot:s540_g16.t1